MGKRGHKNSGSHSGVKAETRRKKRVHLYLYEDLVAEVRRRGYNLSRVVNMVLAGIVSQEDALSRLEKLVVVRWPGFEPGPAAWQAAVLGQARLPPHNCR